ncbi:uncharacterized protein LOC128864849 [Anastrepha ludens]|uniref:uncharacterized protein LOC128864849 n=1 Tax=Anastrepha ludens TaxID=28586 RepID=UPI0023B158C2|nr:uncharacterized protein LOC128864849 [Anastrepha ludens]
MKEHPDIANNFTRSAPNEVELFWENVREELNSLGPPSKSIAEWKQVWSDFKAAVKKKLAHNKREQQSTGGGANRELLLLLLEEDVAALVGLNECVGGIQNTKQFGAPRRTMQRNEDAIDVTPSTSKRTREENISPNFADVIEATFDIEDIENEPMTEGIDAQEGHFKNVNEGLIKLNKSVERLGDYRKKTKEIMKDFLEEAKILNQAMEKNAVEKLKVKKELLSLELGGIDKQLGL